MSRRPRRRPTVITTLAGGLGNQLFQYAAGRALALRTGSRLELDRGSLSRSNGAMTPRPYELGAFDISGDVVDKYGRRKTARLRELLRLDPMPWRETPFRFNPEAVELPGHVRLIGHWLSPLYFSDCSEVIRADLTLREPLPDEAAEIAAHVRSVEGISVHVRRGDYVTAPGTGNRPPPLLLGLEYYRAAAGIMCSRLEHPHFFVFSDEPDWCRAHLDLPGPTTFVDGNGGAPAHDLVLMSLCRHHIIANSSFSWWGAWLSAHDGKLVVAPRQWRRSADGRADLPDLLPETWLRA